MSTSLARHSLRWCSAFQKAAQLLKKQKQLQKDLAALEAQAESLSPDERRLLESILAKAKPPQDSRAVPFKARRTASGPQGFDPKQYRHFAEKEELPDEERVELPRQLRKFLEDAQVLDAVPWDGRPASPTAGSFPKETKESQLRVLHCSETHLIIAAQAALMRTTQAQTIFTSPAYISSRQTAQGNRTGHQFCTVAAISLLVGLPRFAAT